MTTFADQAQSFAKPHADKLAAALAGKLGVTDPGAVADLSAVFEHAAGFAASYVEAKALPLLAKAFGVK